MFGFPPAIAVVGTTPRNRNPKELRRVRVGHAGVFAGAPLPLLSPLLYIGVLSEALLAGASRKAHQMVIFDSEEGDTKLGIILACVCSAIYHVSFVAEDMALSGVAPSLLNPKRTPCGPKWDHSGPNWPC